MPTGPRLYKQASLRIAIPDVPEEMRPKLREIVSLQSEDRGKGHAKALMHQVCAEADRGNVTLMLTAKPFGEGMTQEQLEKFYGSHGFIRIQDEPPLMARQVHRLLVR